MKASMGHLQHVGTSGPEATTITTQYDTGLLPQLQQRIQLLKLENPVWKITAEPGTEGSAQRFIGTLTIGVPFAEDIVVSIPELGADVRGTGLRSKKAVKAVLAQKVWLKLESIPPPTKHEAKGPKKQTLVLPVDDGEGINWIGRILEYNSSLPMEHRHLVYSESSTTLPNVSGPILYSAVLSLAIRAPATDSGRHDSPPYVKLMFPSTDHPELFPSKKQARLHCSRLAGRTLIQQGLLQEDGSLPPKQAFMSPTMQAPKESSVAADIPAMCHKLGLPLPRYEFNSPSGDPSNPFVDCSAHFPPAIGLPVPFVTARNVYGRKRAKDECARMLMENFPKIGEWRLRGGIWIEQPDAIQTADDYSYP